MTLGLLFSVFIKMVILLNNDLELTLPILLKGDFELTSSLYEYDLELGYLPLSTNMTLSIRLADIECTRIQIMGHCSCILVVH